MNPTNSPRPVDWKIVPVPSNPSGGQFCLQAPSGKVYPTYLTASRHLNYFDSNQEEIKILRTGLPVEGWESKTGLPKHWFTKIEEGKLHFLSHDFLEFTSFAVAYDHLFKNKDNFEIDDLTTFYSTFSRPVQAKSSGSKQSPKNKITGKVPSVKITQPKPAFKTKITTARKGDATYSKLKTLVENLGSKEEITNTVAQLISEGWITYKNLPKGWLRSNPQNKAAQVQYLVYDPFCAKFGTKYSAVSSLKRMGLGKKYIGKFIVGDSDIEHFIDTENDNDWVSGNDYLPEGWKIRKPKNNPDPIAVEILSPDDICYKDRVSALRHMSLENARDVFTREEVESLRSKLYHEGWMDHTMIPEGWKINRTKTLSSYLTREGTVIDDSDSAMKLLKDPKSRYTTTDRKNFVEAGDSIIFNNTPIKLKIPVIAEKCLEKEQNKVLLPEGWKIENLTEKMIKITAADGNQFYSRIKAIEHMIENHEDPEMIYSLWGTLDEENWKFGYKFVPVGWGIREPETGQEFLFLTREMEVLINVEQALDYIENDDAYTGEDYKMLKKWNDNYTGVTWVEDDDIPKGWKKTEDDEEEEQFVGPLGTIITGRVALIQHLIKENHPPDELISLWGTLDLEGWMNDNKNLPLGWKSKYFPELDEYHYLSPLMQVVKSDTDLVKLITDCKLTSPDEKLMVQHLKKWASTNYQ